MLTFSRILVLQFDFDLIWIFLRHTRAVLRGYWRRSGIHPCDNLWDYIVSSAHHTTTIWIGKVLVVAFSRGFVPSSPSVQTCTDFADSEIAEPLKNWFRTTETRSKKRQCDHKPSLHIRCLKILNLTNKSVLDVFTVLSHKKYEVFNCF